MPPMPVSVVQPVPTRVRRAALLLLLAVPAPVVAADDAPKDKTPVTEVIIALRKAPVADALPGVLLDAKNSKAVEGQLRLAGFVDNEVEKRAAEQEAAKLLQKEPAWAKAFPKGVSAAGMKVLPLRSILQKDFATARRDDARTREILQQTRVDSLRTNDEVLVVRYVCIYGAPGEDVPDTKPIIARATQALLEADSACKDLFNLNWKVKGEEAHPVALPDRPVQVLQYRSSTDAALDGTLIRRAAYDAKGALVVQGQLPTREAADKLEAFLKDEAKADARHWLRPVAAGSGPRWSLDVKTVPWTLRKDLQAGLAAADLRQVLNKVPPDDLKQVRIDRAYYTYSGMSPNERGMPIRFELRLAGFSFADFEKEARKDELQAWLRAALKKYPDLAKVDREDIRIRPVSEPRFDLQPLVAADKKLDGVRIDGGSRFAADGTVLLQGVWRGDIQEPELRKVVDGYFAVTASAGLHGAKAGFAEFKVVPTDKLLRTLRLRAARELEDVWLDRLYYDKKGELCLTGFYPANKGDAKAKIDGWLKELMKDVSGGEKAALLGPRPRRLVVSRKARALALADPPQAPRLDLQGRKGLAQHLRGQVQYPAGRGADASKYQVKWDGILVRRCYYDLDGVYIVNALIDSEAQGKDFAALVRDTEKDLEWQTQLVRGWRDRFTLMPVAPMVARLQVVIPNYPVFDGLTLVSVVHDTQNRLLLRAQVVGDMPTRVAREKMREILHNAPKWSERAEVGVGFRAVTQQERNPELAAAMALKALSCMRLLDVETSRDYATTAILHNPDDSTAWFVRGLGYLLAGDHERADRDLRRVAMREAPVQPDGGGQRVRRVRELEMIQGVHRRRAEVVLARMALDLRDGKPPVIRLEAE
jgi:hypothetical protein